MLQILSAAPKLQQAVPTLGGWWWALPFTTSRSQLRSPEAVPTLR